MAQARSSSAGMSMRVTPAGRRSLSRRSIACSLILVRETAGSSDSSAAPLAHRRAQPARLQRAGVESRRRDSSRDHGTQDRITSRAMTQTGTLGWGRQSGGLRRRPRLAPGGSGAERNGSGSKAPRPWERRRLGAHRPVRRGSASGERDLHPAARGARPGRDNRCARQPERRERRGTQRTVRPHPQAAHQGVPRRQPRVARPTGRDDPGRDRRRRPSARRGHPRHLDADPFGAAGKGRRAPAETRHRLRRRAARAVHQLLGHRRVAARTQPDAAGQRRRLCAPRRCRADAESGFRPVSRSPAGRIRALQDLDQTRCGSCPRQRPNGPPTRPTWASGSASSCERRSARSSKVSSTRSPTSGTGSRTSSTTTCTTWGSAR